MDLCTIKEELKSRFTIFQSQDSVKQWIKNNGYTWVTKNNQQEVNKKISEYVKKEVKIRIEALQNDLENAIDASFQGDLSVHSSILDSNDSLGAIIGGGGGALLTLLIEGAVCWPAAIATAIAGFFIGREKMTNDFANRVFDSSKEISNKIYDNIAPLIDNMMKEEAERNLPKQSESTKESCQSSEKHIYVNHLTFGKGKIENISEKIAEISFGEQTKRFPFPDSFIANSNSKIWLDIGEGIDNSVRMIKYLEKTDIPKKYCTTSRSFISTIENKSWFQECIDRYMLLQLMKKRKEFVGFIHTTNFSNFNQIYKSKKLLSRNKLISMNIHFDDCAEADIINSTDATVKNCNRFYFRCKTPTNYSAYKYHKQKHPVIFLLKEEYIYSREAIFFDGNARANKSRYTKDSGVAREFFNWDCIFSSVPTYECDVTNEFLKKNNCSLTELKRCQNAEFLCNDEIPLDAFEKICFNFLEDYQKAIQTYGNDKRFSYEPAMFWDKEIK